MLLFFISGSRKGCYISVIVIALVGHMLRHVSQKTHSPAW